MPLTIDQASELYQNFYVHVDSSIATHIATLSSRISREKSPAPSTSSVGSSTSKSALRKGSRRQDTTDENGPDQQMLTASEITDRKKTRRQLELKRVALEEAVERGVCEKVYPRLWRHRSTDDEARDEKLRSRAAALSVLGVDLKELLSTSMTSDDSRSNANLSASLSHSESPVRKQLAEANFCLDQMNNDRYPQGKLLHLTAAHKMIVETLSQMFPSSSSADEILPTLIYLIITSGPENAHVISNFNFIQRFRAAGKIDGEAAYCLTNLEAAISFLENVDLSSIRPDETSPSQTKSSSRPSTPKMDSNPLYRGFPTSPTSPERKAENQPPEAAKHSRSLSNLLGSRPRPLEEASGAVLNSADTAFDAMHNALDGSFRFLFGRFKEQQAIQSPGGSAEVTVPKTLEDARKLVSSPSMTHDDDQSIGDDSSIHENKHAETFPETAESKMLELVGGRRAPRRERSFDSLQSPGSARRPGADKDHPLTTPAQGNNETDPGTMTGSHNPAYNPVESMKAFGNSMNPLKGFSMRGFSRVTSSPLYPASKHAPPDSAGNEVKASDHNAVPVHSVDECKPASGLGVDITGIAPPIQRFTECREAKELNGYDVELLLRDYQRLSGALRALREI